MSCNIYINCTCMWRNCISSLSCILTMRRHIHKFIKPCITCACAMAHFRFVVTLQSNIWNVHLLYLNNLHVQCTLYVNHIFNLVTTIWHPSERQRERENNWELPRPKGRVETHLEIIAHINCWSEELIVGALGTVSNDIEKCFAEIGVTCHLESSQRTCLLDTARSLRKVSDT